MSEKSEDTYKEISAMVEQFLSLAGPHMFTTDQIDRQYNIKSSKGKENRWHILERMVEKERLEKMGTGKYRLVDSQMETIDWQSADVEDTVKVEYPLELHEYIKTYHKSINIIAGAPGAGKTAFVYDFILRNMGNPMGIILFTNDMTAEEIKERMKKAEYIIPEPAPWITFDRADNFGDVVEPDKINIIDYLDLNSEVYRIGEEIEKIYRKLGRGIALIGIQKKPGQALGQGGVFSIKRAKLYFTLDTFKMGLDWWHTLSIEKARGRAVPTMNPRSIKIRFKLINGITFIPQLSKEKEEIE